MDNLQNKIYLEDTFTHILLLVFTDSPYITQRTMKKLN